MKEDNVWKIYYLTCHLLSQFKGIHSMIAEHDLVGSMTEYINEKLTEKKLLEKLEFNFGLSKRNLNKALKDYEADKKEYEEL